MFIRSVFSILIFVLIFPTVGHADYIFAPSLTVSSPDVSGGTDNTQLSSIDAKFGYTFDYGLYVGALYALGKEKNSQTGVDATSFVFGPSVGFNMWNVYAITTYHIFGERDLSAGGIKYANATGVQVDLGYVFSLTNTVSLGPQVTYRDVRFNDKQVQGLSEADSFQWTGITPYISLWLNFN